MFLGKVKACEVLNLQKIQVQLCDEVCCCIDLILYVFFLKEFHEIPFLKKFKFKRQDRVFPKEPPASPAAAPASSTAASASASAASSSSFPTELPTEVPAGQNQC